jgi:hypothetical protein
MAIYIKDGSGWQQLTSLDRPYANVGGVNISAAGYIPAYGTTLYGTSTPHGLNTGDIVTISGVTPSSFNTTAVANVFDSVQFYFTLFNGSTGGAYSSGGTTSTFKPVKNVYANVSGTWNETFAYFETSGGTSYDAGAGYTGVYFTANGTFTILNGTRDIEYFVLSGGSGGGGGGRNSSNNTRGGGGGGAGGNYVTGTSLNTGVGTYSITVGGGGTGGAGAAGAGPNAVYLGSAGSSGGTSGGGWVPTITGPDGGTAGRGGNNGTIGTFGGIGRSNNHYSGGAGGNTANGINITRAGGGGAGSGGSGTSAATSTPGSGGALFTVPIASTFSVGKGGNGGTGTVNGLTLTEYGSGGGGGGAIQAAAAGVGGIFFIRWLT